MDEDLRSRLFDPTDAHALVLAHRPAGCPAVAAVVSDAVWQDVVRLLRWTAASTSGAPELDGGRWWRLASGCAQLLRRLPALCDELGEDWDRTAVADDDDAADGVDRVGRTAERLLALLRTGEPVPLRTIAGEIDALGAAAITALAQTSSWAVPD